MNLKSDLLYVCMYVCASSVCEFIVCRGLSQRNDEPERASRPWDKHRDGFVMGEGAGVLVIILNYHNFIMSSKKQV